MRATRRPNHPAGFRTWRTSTVPDADRDRHLGDANGERPGDHGTNTTVMPLIVPGFEKLTVLTTFKVGLPVPCMVPALTNVNDAAGVGPPFDDNV